MIPQWQAELDVEWAVERVLLDGAAHCGTCGSGLYTNGTCPICDRAPRVAGVACENCGAEATDWEACGDPCCGRCTHPPKPGERW